MLKVFVLYLHLLATCLAVGAILATDVRLLARWRDTGFRIVPPNRLLSQLIIAALIVLCATGAGLIAIGLSERPDFLANPKLQAKLVVVALLIGNAVLLHSQTFPRLLQGRLMRPWSQSIWVGVAVPIALSNSLWLYATFLGIARPWNFTKPASEVLGIAVALAFLTWCGVMLVILVAAKRQRDRHDSTKLAHRVSSWHISTARRVAKATVERVRKNSAKPTPSPGRRAAIEA